VRVLVIQLRQLGDLLMTTPLLRQLAARLPGAGIDLLCEPIGERVLALHPALRERILLPRGSSLGTLLALGRTLRRRRYDLVIDTQVLPKTALLARMSGAPLRLGYGGALWRSLAYNRRLTRSRPDYSALDKLNLLACGLDRSAAPDLEDLELEFPVGPEDRAAAERFCRERFP
jgi:heptosyltransferase III